MEKKIRSTANFFSCLLSSAFIFTGCIDMNDTTAKDFVIGRSSKEMAKNMIMGWNLGNTLDATPDYYDTFNHFVSRTPVGPTTETLWGMPYTTEDMIKEIKKMGFTSIRIPVTWHNNVQTSRNEAGWTVTPGWLGSVKRIVDYAYKQDLCVIINVHHDNLKDSEEEIGTHPGYVLTQNETYKKKSNAYLNRIWTDIATKFRDYDNKLVFEVLNEPRYVRADANNTDIWELDNEESARKANTLIREYEETCIKAIRATGGNNANRYLMVPSYAASPFGYMLSTYELPEDTADDKLILSLHAYAPSTFAMKGNENKFTQAHKNELSNLFSSIRKRFPQTGIVIGETSAENKGNTREREKWASYFFGTAYNNFGMSVFLWDNMDFNQDTEGTNGERHGYFDRTYPYTWKFPTIVEAARKAVNGK